MSGNKPRVVVDQAGNRVAVMLDIDEYNRLLEASERLESLRAQETDTESGPAYTPEEKKLMEDRLKSLGYF
jgi:hypothetical protein